MLIALGVYLPQALALDVETFSLSSSAFEGPTLFGAGLQLESPDVGWPGAFSGGLGLVYAHGQLVQVNADESETPIVNDSFATRLSGAYTVLGRARVALELPLYPYVGGQANDAINGVSIGDLRLKGVVPLPLGASLPIRLSVVPAISLPTGEAKAYMGAGGVGASLGIAAGYTVRSWVDITGNLGFRAMPSSTIGEQPIGSAIDFGVGGAYPLRESIDVGLEIDGVVDLAGGVSPWTDNPWEVHAFGRYGAEAGLQAVVGLGTGLVGGIGAPDVRLVGAVGWRMPGKAPIVDLDGDGLLDDVDACIDVPEDIDRFEDADGCPDLDDDRDGVPDTTDACKDDPEDIDTFEDADGCPDPDNDADTVLDAADACPDIAGKVELEGCPDRDGDRVPDTRDRCPDEAIDPREDPARSDGCPKRVFVTLEKIEILDNLYFETNKTTIKKQSYALLAEVARVLNDSPDILRVEVAGHTDSVGRDSANLKLSQGRAEAVVKHLVATGKVDAGRLTAVGYGEVVPVDANATEAGRGNNRRVEFVIKGFRGQPTR